MAGQLMRMADGRAMQLEQPPRFNPRPAGVIQEGSASAALLAVLKAHPNKFFTHGGLMAVTGRSHAAVSWGLKYLRDQGLVKTINDGSRNPKWFRYRIVKE